MRPVKQRNLHQPERGVYGDCHRAAIASVFEVPIDQVPHFMDGGDVDRAVRMEAEWLRQRGLASVSVPYIGTLREVQDALGKLAPGIHYLFGGTSRSGVNHTVVGCGGRIVHDPSRNNSGIVGPCDDGFFWVTYFVPLRPECCVAPVPRREPLLARIWERIFLQGCYFTWVAP